MSNLNEVKVFQKRERAKRKVVRALAGTDDQIEARIVKLRVGLAQIRRVCNSVYATRAKSSTELLEEIAAIAADAMRGTA